MLSRQWLNGLLLVSLLLSNGCLSLMGGEERAGAQAARQVEAEMGLVHDPVLEAYVREIGNRLVKNASRQNITWRFQIVDMSAPNAFALPGGYVYVSRGLLALVNNEAELAGVIGHEIGHVTAGHGNKRVTVAAPFMILSGITGWATGIVSPRLGEAVSGTGNMMAQGLVIAPFSRSQERQADRIGAELSAKEGWDPEALGHFLENLGRFEQLVTGEKRRAGWLDSHPASPERAAANREFASKLERAAPNPVARDQSDLFHRLDGLLLGPDAAAGVIVGDRFVHPDLGWSIRFPEGWSLMNTPTSVVSGEPDRKAAVVLQLAATNKSLEALIAEIEEEAPSGLEIERKTIHGRAAANTVIEQSGSRIDVTWLEHRDHVYQIMGVSRRREQATWQATFDQTIRSLRDVEADELERIRDRRLRIATADTDETLASLLKRVDSNWDTSAAAVANGIESDARLDGGQLVKFSKEGPYMPRR